ncbi:MAG: AI-2E family transporter [Dehalococcoidia bacterium]
MERRTEIAPILRLLIGGACAFVLLDGLQQTADLLVPLLITLMVVLSTTPFVLRLQQRGLPPRLAVVGAYVIVAGVGVILLLFFAHFLQEFAEQMPEYQAAFDARMESMTFDSDGRLNGEAIIGVAQAVCFALLDTVETAVFVFPAAMLVMLDSPRILAQVPVRVESDTEVARNLDEVRSSIVGFLSVSARSGLFLALGSTAVLWLLGIDFAAFFGFLTFAANFIPSFGLLFAAVPAVIMAWVQYGWPRAILVAIGFWGVSLLVGSMLGRKAMQRRLNLSAPALFLGAFFWAFVLGPAGALVGAPITAFIRIVLDSSRQTRWLARLMSAPPLGSDSPTPVRRDGAA